DRSERVDGRKLSGGKGEGVVVLAAVKRLAVRIELRQGIQCLQLAVAVDSSLCACGAEQEVVVKEGSIAPERTDAPAVDVLYATGDKLSDLVVAFLHGQQDGGLVFQRQFLERKSLARTDADTRELAPDILVFR